ncbi:hypothetical protein RND81_08G034100 [Saponaria officinalis]|uniref:Pectinesterase n=1 Tax=Saponaria officinalis TaxID=3572 RepID=A0AAW1J2Z6_SAPOF
MAGNSTTSKTPQNSTNKNTTISLFIFFIILTIFTLVFSVAKPPSSTTPAIKTACSNTLYPSLCLTTLSPYSQTPTTPHRLLQASIERTIDFVSITQSKIVTYFAQKRLSSQETNAFNDCIDLLDQTLFELRQALGEIRFSTRLKTLLSAAMTNEITCIDGFSDLYKLNPQIGHKPYIETTLKPVIYMISNSLAIVKHINGINSGPKHGFPTRNERKLMGLGNYRIKPNVVVAGDGSGDYTTVMEAIKMAPNMSMIRYVIKIKAGIYRENVEISRNKMNIMLMGDGINCTIITASRSFVDGFSTFTSATLTVSGDRFMARDLTIENTATRDKYQAVAARINSNSLFYRCNFTSYQDTLYAHSLRQFYRECIIQGTVDFIFGNAAAVFHNCHILARKPNPGQSNMITAQSRDDPNQNTGFSLHNCTIQAAPDFNVTEMNTTFTFLGRPWRNFSRTVVTRSYLGDLIHPLGWSVWDEYSNLETVEYVEYKNFGPGSDTRFRVGWRGFKKNCSEGSLKKFSVGAFLHSPDDWLNSTKFPLFHGQ